MLRSAKRKGTKNEHKSVALLEAAGYRVTRAGGSLGVFDLIGIGAHAVVLVQVKTNRWPNPAEMEGIKDFPCPPNAAKLVHRWNDYQRVPDVKEVA